jgi:hypothetical protein
MGVRTKTECVQPLVWHEGANEIPFTLHCDDQKVILLLAICWVRSGILSATFQAIGS